MLVTFKTSAWSDITLFGTVATTLLKMMGQSGSVPGALMADDVAPALDTLRESLREAAEDAGAAASGESFDDNDDDGDDSGSQRVPIASRAKPLVELLEAARDANENVIWEQ